MAAVSSSEPDVFRLLPCHPLVFTHFACRRLLKRIPGGLRLGRDSGSLTLVTATARASSLSNTESYYYTCGYIVLI